MCGSFFTLKIKNNNKRKINKNWLKTTSASSSINSKVPFICKGLIWLQNLQLPKQGPHPRSVSIGPSKPFIRGRVSQPVTISPHLSRAHRSQTPLTQHAPYSLFSSHDSRLIVHKRRKKKGGKKQKNAKDRIVKVALCAFGGELLGILALQPLQLKKKKR